MEISPYLAELILEMMINFSEKRHDYNTNFSISQKLIGFLFLNKRQLQETLYPDMLHITCVAHEMHRVAEFIRDSHPKTDKLVAALKKILLKCPRRKRNYTEKTQLQLPPQAVIT